MTALDFSEEKFIHRQQIVQLLRLAIDKRWRFTYMTIDGKKVISHPVSLRSVNVESGTFTLDRELVNEGCNVKQQVLFRGQTGGLSILFQCRVSDGVNADSNGIVRPAYEAELPYEIRCTQLRSSRRVNLQELKEDCPATLYLAMGYKLEGKLIDISVSGAQILIGGDQSDRFRNLQILESCSINLEHDFTLRSGAQLTSMRYVEGDDTSVVHCQFDEMADEDELRLCSFICSTLTEHAALAPA